MCVLPCAVLFFCFSVLLALRLPRFGGRGGCWCFSCVWVCPFPLPLDVWEGLRFVIVAHSGLFSSLFLAHRGSTIAFYLLCHLVELAMSTLFVYHSDEFGFYVLALMH